MNANFVATQVAGLQTDAHDVRIFVCDSTGKVVILRRKLSLAPMSQAPQYGEWERIAEVEVDG